MRNRTFFTIILLTERYRDLLLLEKPINDRTIDRALANLSQPN